MAFFGALDLSNVFETGRFALSPKDIIIHSQWNPDTTQYDSDLSILQFEHKSIHFNDYVQPICLLDPHYEPPVSKAKVVGWGKSEDQTKKHENIAKVVDALIQTNEQCFLDEKALIDISSRLTFCAGLRNGSGVCLGDSGGGLFIKENGVSYLKGVVSSSLIKDEQCDVSKNAVYTNVPMFSEWIGRTSGLAIGTSIEHIGTTTHSILSTFGPYGPPTEGKQISNEGYL